MRVGDFLTLTNLRTNTLEKTQKTPSQEKDNSTAKRNTNLGGLL